MVYITQTICKDQLDKKCTLGHNRIIKKITEILVVSNVYTMSNAFSLILKKIYGIQYVFFSYSYLHMNVKYDEFSLSL